MTKSIKRNKTFKSKKNKKNKKGGSTNNPLLVTSEVEDEIKELFTKLNLSECETDMIILNHDDVEYLKKYIQQKQLNATQFQIVLLQKLKLLTNLKSGCKYVFNLNDILQHSNPNLLNTDNYLNNYTFGESYRNNIGNRSPSPRDRPSFSPSPSPRDRDRGRPSLSPSPEPRDRGRGRPSLSPDPNYLVPNPFN